MDVRNCKNCSRLFNYLSGQQLCPECVKALESKYEEVKEYIYDHPNIGMQQVAEDMDVSVNQIKRWVREERLTFSEEAQIGLECEGCGKLIRTGRFCENCKKKFVNGFAEANKSKEPAIEKKPFNNSAKMHFVE